MKPSKQVDRIYKLTPKQEVLMDEVRQRWIEIGLCAEPANRPASETAILESYRLAGLEPPEKIIWCGSPLSQGLTRAIVLNTRTFVSDSVSDSVRASVWASVRDSVRDSVWASVWDSVRDSVWDSVWDSVRDSVRDSVWDSVGDSVWDPVRYSVWASVRDSVGDSVSDSVWASVWDFVRASVRASVSDSVSDSVGYSVRDSVGDSVWDSVLASVRDSVRDSVWASVWDSVRDSVGDSVSDSVRDSVRDSVGDSVYGQHESPWLSFYDFFRICGLVRETNKIQGLVALAKNSGWVLPHKNICWASERHNVLMRDNAGRLHNLSGPAVAYPDGWAIYAVHGVRVPANWIENSKSLNVKTALTWKNIEQRRAAAEIVGWERILKELEPLIVDVDADPMIGSLLAVDLPDAPNSRFLKVKCGTGRTFILPVPSNVTTALEANAWTYGLDSNDYKLEVRT